MNCNINAVILLQLRVTATVCKLEFAMPKKKKKWKRLKNKRQKIPTLETSRGAPAALPKARAQSADKEQNGANPPRKRLELTTKSKSTE